MAFLVSPGVQVKEIDLTNVIPATSASIGAIAGSFQWGPADTVVTVGSEQQLVQVFGQPNDDTFRSVLSAAQFLSYGNSLRVVRKVGAGARNASDSLTTGALLINNSYDANTYTGDCFAAARYPGDIGNNITCEICIGGDDFGNWDYADNFTSAPGTSASATAVGATNDEMHVCIIDIAGGITGTPGQVLETFSHVSQASDAKTDDGTSNFYRDVVNKGSNWIHLLNDATDVIATFGAPLLDGTVPTQYLTTVAGAAEDFLAFDLAGGISEDNLTLGEMQLAYDFFEDPETVEISLLINGNTLTGTDATAMANYLTTIADTRKDCVAFLSPPQAATVNNQGAEVTDMKLWRDTLTSSSYSFADSTALYVYDKYNDKYRWLAASGSMAGLSANADMTADAWFSPAGFTRGNVRNVTKLAFNPKQVNRDDLYKVGINPIVSFPGAGIILYGDKTLQSKASAFDRINVRRLFITLEKAVSRASKASLFEFNDEFTRAQFRNMTEPFLRDIKGRRGITDFKVVCDESNNTGDVIDTNRFVADIYIKPARSINFITLNFIATRTGVEFSEIAGGN
jgi:hypothetical protein